MGYLSFKVDDDIYDIDEKELDRFLEVAPDARQIESYKVDGDVYDLDIGEVDKFLAAAPDAEPWGKEKEDAWNAMTEEERTAVETSKLRTPDGEKLFQGPGTLMSTEGQNYMPESYMDFMQNKGINPWTTKYEGGHWTLRDELDRASDNYGEILAQPLFQLQEVLKKDKNLEWATKVVDPFNELGTRQDNKDYFDKFYSGVKSGTLQFFGGTTKAYDPAAGMIYDGINDMMEKTIGVSLPNYEEFSKTGANPFRTLSDLVDPITDMAKDITPTKDFEKGTATLIREGFMDLVTGKDGGGQKLKDAGYQLSLQSAEQLPQLIGQMALAAAGMPNMVPVLFGISAMGSKYDELMDDPNAKDMDIQTKRFNAFMAFVFEYLSERILGMGPLKRLFPESGSETVKEVMQYGWKQGMTELWRASRNEALEEGFNNISNLILDRMTGRKDPEDATLTWGELFLKYGDKLAEEMLLGGIGGAQMGVVGGSGKGIRKRSMQERANELVREMMDKGGADTEVLNEVLAIEYEAQDAPTKVNPIAYQFLDAETKKKVDQILLANRLKEEAAVKKFEQLPIEQQKKIEKDILAERRKKGIQTDQTESLPADVPADVPAQEDIQEPQPQEQVQGQEQEQEQGLAAGDVLSDEDIREMEVVEKEQEIIEREGLDAAEMTEAEFARVNKLAIEEVDMEVPSFQDDIPDDFQPVSGPGQVDPEVARLNKIADQVEKAQGKFPEDISDEDADQVEQILEQRAKNLSEADTGPIGKTTTGPKSTGEVTYRCDNCGLAGESDKDAGEIPCPNCGAKMNTGKDTGPVPFSISIGGPKGKNGQPSNLTPKTLDRYYNHINEKLAENIKGAKNARPPENLTDEQVEVSFYGEKTGVPILFFEADNIGRGVGGFNYQPSDSEQFIAINAKASNPVGWLLGHETMHAMKKKNPEGYKKLIKSLKEGYDAHHGEGRFDKRFTKSIRSRIAAEIQHGFKGVVDQVDTSLSLDDNISNIINNLSKEQLDGYAEEFIANDQGSYFLVYDASVGPSGAIVLNRDLLDRVTGNRTIWQQIKDVIVKIARVMGRKDILDQVHLYEKYLKDSQGKPLQSLKTGEATFSIDNDGHVDHEDIKFSVRTNPPPKKTVKGYKLFRVGKDGKLYPLFVKANEVIPTGTWLDADIGEHAPDGKKVKSKIGPLAYRPGWHGGDMPVATHIGEGGKPGKPAFRPDDQVWAEVEFADDQPWQDEADKRAQLSKSGAIIARTAHITDQIPTDGHYRYKTNPNMTGEWIISGSMKVNRVLSDEEVGKINATNGVSDLPRKGAAPVKTETGPAQGDLFANVSNVKQQSGQMLNAKKELAKTEQPDLFDGLNFSFHEGQMAIVSEELAHLKNEEGQYVMPKTIPAAVRRAARFLAMDIIRKGVHRDTKGFNADQYMRELEKVIYVRGLTGTGTNLIFDFQYGQVFGTVTDMISYTRNKDLGNLEYFNVASDADAEFYLNEKGRRMGMSSSLDNPVRVRSITRNEYALKLGTKAPVQAVVRENWTDTTRKGKTVTGFVTQAKAKGWDKAIKSALGLTLQEFRENVKKGNLDHVKQIANLGNKARKDSNLLLLTKEELDEAYKLQTGQDPLEQVELFDNPQRGTQDDHPDLLTRSQRALTDAGKKAQDEKAEKEISEREAIVGHITEARKKQIDQPDMFSALQFAVMGDLFDLPPQRSADDKGHLSSTAGDESYDAQVLKYFGKRPKGPHEHSIAANLVHMKSHISEWSAVPITGMAPAAGPGGKVIEMPVFQMPKGYKPGPTRYPQSNTGDETGNCEWCSHPIKNVFWIQNDKQKWVMACGSECITTFDINGYSGKDLQKQSKDDTPDLFSVPVDGKDVKDWEAYTVKLEGLIKELELDKKNTSNKESLQAIDELLDRYRKELTSFREKTGMEEKPVKAQEEKPAETEKKAPAKPQQMDQPALFSITDSPEFKKWFKGSKVVDYDGNPRVMYHATMDEFNTFRHGDLGFHFGTEAAGREVIEYRHIEDPDDANYIKAFLKLENPLELGDVGDWGRPSRVRTELEENGIEPPESYVHPFNKLTGHRTQSNGQWGNTVPEIQAQLMELGYDGVEYENAHEDVGSTSYMVFNANQIKSADPTTYDDKGNEIPMKKRFNKKRDDLRFAFAGSWAKTADLTALDRAEKLEKAGKSKGYIRAATGWFRGKFDDQWRFEIDDSKAVINEQKLFRNAFEPKQWDGVLGQVLQHKDLFKAYPELRDASLEIIETDSNSRPSAAFISNPDDPSESPTVQLYIPTYRSAEYEGKPTLNKDNKKSLMHEIQHAIQMYEGFARGGSPKEIIEHEQNILKTLQWQMKQNKTRRKEILNDDRFDATIKKMMINQLQTDNSQILDRMEKAGEIIANANENYYLHAGEIEARDVASRTHLDQRVREQLEPYTNEKIGKKDAVLKFSVTERSPVVPYDNTPMGNVDASNSNGKTEKETAGPVPQTKPSQVKFAVSSKSGKGFRTLSAKTRFMRQLFKVGSITLTHQKIENVSDAAALLYELRNPVQERMTLLPLDENNNVLKTGPVVLHVGSINASMVDFKMVNQAIAATKAKKFILCHNHPSGDVSPSVQDIDLQTQLEDMLKSGENESMFIDHVIINGTKFFSMRESEEYEYSPREQESEQDLFGESSVPKKMSKLPVNMLGGGFGEVKMSENSVVTGQPESLERELIDTPTAAMSYMKQVLSPDNPNAISVIGLGTKNQIISVNVLETEMNEDGVIKDKSWIMDIASVPGILSAIVCRHGTKENLVNLAALKDDFKKHGVNLLDALTMDNSNVTSAVDGGAMEEPAKYAVTNKPHLTERQKRDIIKRNKELSSEIEKPIQEDTREDIRANSSRSYETPRGKAEAAAQKAYLQVAKLPLQTIVTLNDAFQWLDSRGLYDAHGDTLPGELIRNLMDHPDFDGMSIFDQIRLSAQLQRKWYKHNYPTNLPIRGKSNKKTSGIKRGNRKTHKSNIIPADTVRGCDHCCADCYGMTNARQSSYSHLNPIRVELEGELRDKEVLRLGEVGDPSRDWAWTNQQVSGMLERSRKAGYEVSSMKNVFCIVKLLNIENFDPKVTPNLQITLDPLYPAHMQQTMANVMKLAGMYPSVNMVLRIRSLVSTNEDLMDSQHAALTFANSMNIPVLETRMRMKSKEMAKVLQIDETYYYKKPGDNVQHHLKEWILEGNVNEGNFHVCDRKNNAQCGACKNCNRTMFFNHKRNIRKRADVSAFRDLVAKTPESLDVRGGIPEGLNFSIEDGPVDSARITKAQWSKIATHLKRQGFDIRGADDAKELNFRRDRDLINTNDRWKEAYDSVVGKEKKAKDHKASTKYVDWSRVKELGYTGNLKEAGYVTPEGKLIDLSGKKEGGMAGMRNHDHREVGDGSRGMQEFGGLGNIRYMPESNSMDIYKEPTEKQYARIREIVSKARNEDGVILSLQDGLGKYDERSEYYSDADRMFEREYPVSTPASKIVNDIKTFFAGQQPYVSPNLKFSVTETPEFKKWFGDSKVVDEDGKPLVVYHGTDQQFNEFDPGHRGIIYFTSDMEYAEAVGESNGVESTVYPVYISLKNPARGSDPKVLDILENSFPSDSRETIKNAFDEGYDPYEYFETTAVIEELSKLGYDGVAFWEEGQESFGVFSPNQIKSADPTTHDDQGNEIPASDRFTDSPDIRFSVTTVKKEIADLEKKIAAKVAQTYEEHKGKTDHEGRDVYEMVQGKKAADLKRWRSKLEERKRHLARLERSWEDNRLRLNLNGEQGMMQPALFAVTPAKNILTKEFVGRINSSMDKVRSEHPFPGKHWFQLENSEDQKKLSRWDKKVHSTFMSKLLSRKIPVTATKHDAPGDRYQVLHESNDKEDPWRITRLDYLVNDSLSPSGHSMYKTYKEALSAMYSDGFQQILSYDETMSIPHKKKRDALFSVTSEKDIVNAIDVTASQEEKVKQLKELSLENKPLIDRFVESIDKELGTSSSSSFKNPDSIIKKANRPSIKSEKPWFDVEHVRDSLRFKTVINALDDVAKIIDKLPDLGAELVKVDTGKMLKPKEWGWRFAAFDLRMPNGQLVEYYMPLVEQEEAKKNGNHDLFDKWRNKTPQDLEANWEEYISDVGTSYQKYQDAWDKALERLGLDESAASASWKKFEASLESVTRSKLSLKSSAVGTPMRQTPPTRSKGLGKSPGAPTKTRPESGSTETKNSSFIKTSPFDNNNINDKGKEVKGKDKKVGFSISPSPDAPFYSQLQKVLDQKIQGSTTSAANINALLKDPGKHGIKPEEIEWSGLEDYLAMNDGKVSKDDLMSFLRDHQVVVKDVVKGDKAFDGWTEQEIRSHYADMFGDDEDNSSIPLADIKRAITEYEDDQFSNVDRPETAPKYETYTLPGGKDYRELLITMPRKMGPSKKQYRTIRSDEDYEVYAFDTETGEELGSEANYDMLEHVMGEQGYTRQETGTGDYFKKEHWDESNILVHLRFNTRTDSQGRKIMFLEEVQSDWHQDGRKRGYAEKKITELPEGYTALVKEGDDAWRVEDSQGNMIGPRSSDRQGAIDNALRALNAETIGTPGSRVPNAPFKSTTAWTGLALKRAMMYAAENGFDAVAWVNGEQSADRYDLSKQIDKIDYRKEPDGRYWVRAVKEKSSVFAATVDENEVENLVGKEMTEKIISDQGKKDPFGNFSSLTGLDLKVGGEGMKDYYDKLVPNTVNKLFKKYGAKTEVIDIDTSDEERRDQLGADGDWYVMQGDRVADGPFENRDHADMVRYDLAKGRADGETFTLVRKAAEDRWSKQLSVPVTDKLKNEIRSNGLPLFAISGNRDYHQRRAEAMREQFPIYHYVKYNYTSLAPVGGQEAEFDDYLERISPSARKRGQGGLLNKKSMNQADVVADAVNNEFGTDFTGDELLDYLSGFGKGGPDVIVPGSPAEQKALEKEKRDAEVREIEQAVINGEYKLTAKDLREYPELKDLAQKEIEASRVGQSPMDVADKMEENPEEKVRIYQMLREIMYQDDIEKAGDDEFQKLLAAQDYVIRYAKKFMPPKHREKVYKWLKGKTLKTNAALLHALEEIDKWRVEDPDLDVSFKEYIRQYRLLNQDPDGIVMSRYKGMVGVFKELERLRGQSIAYGMELSRKQVQAALSRLEAEVTRKMPVAERGRMRNWAKRLMGAKSSYSTEQIIKHGLEQIDRYMDRYEHRQNYQKLKQLIQLETARLRKAARSERAPLRRDLEVNEKMKLYIELISGKWSRETVNKFNELNRHLEENPEENIPKHLVPVMRLMGQKNITQMNARELREAIDNINSLNEDGRMDYESEDYERLQQLQRNANAVAKQIHRHTGGAPSTKLVKFEKNTNDHLDKKIIDKLKRLSAKGIVQVGRPERIIEWFTGFEDSYLKKMTFDKMLESEEIKLKNIEKAQEHFQELYKDIDIAAAMHDVLETVEITDPEDGKKVEIRITLDKLMFIYAHNQSKDGQAHLVGTGLYDLIEKAETELPKKYRDLVDRQIQYYDEVQWERMSTVFQKQMNVRMAKVEKYFPIQNLDIQHAENMTMKDLAARFSSRPGSVQKGIVKGRTGSSAAMKHGIYFNTVMKNIFDTEHYIAYNQNVREANEFLNNEDIREAMNHRSEEATKEVHSWLRQVAYGKIRRTGNVLDDVSDILRTNYVVSVLGLNLVTVMKQPASVFQGMRHVNAHDMKRAAKDFLFDHRATVEFVESKSTMMRHRKNNIERELAEMAEKGQFTRFANIQSKYEKAKELSMLPIQAADLATTTILWKAKYSEVINATGSDSRAVAEANALIRKTQPMGGLMHIPAVMRSNGFVRAYTMFTNQLNQQANLAFETAYRAKEKGFKHTAVSASMYFLLPTLMIYLASNAFRLPWRPWDGEDDFEGLAETFVSGMFGGIPFLSQVMNAMTRAGTNRIRTWRGKKKAHSWGTKLAPTSMQGLEDLLNGTEKSNLKTMISGGLNVSGVPAIVPMKRVYNVLQKSRNGEEISPWEMVYHENVLKPQEYDYQTYAKRISRGHLPSPAVIAKVVNKEKRELLLDLVQKHAPERYENIRNRVEKILDAKKKKRKNKKSPQQVKNETDIEYARKLWEK